MNIHKVRIIFTLVFTTLISFFMFENVVLASAHMWLECYFDDNNCAGSKDCKDSIDWNHFAIINDKNGEPRSLAINVNKFKSENGKNRFYSGEKYVGFVSNDCWFKNIGDIEEKCSKKKFEKVEDASTLLKNGQCPVGLRQYYKSEAVNKEGQNYFRVPAGVSGISPLNKQIISQPEIVLYKFKVWPYYDSDQYKKMEQSTFYIYVLEAYDVNGKYGYVVSINYEGLPEEKYQTDKFNEFYSNVLYYSDNNNINTLYSGGENYHKSSSIENSGMSQLVRLFYINDKSSYYKVSTEYDARLISIATNLYEKDIDEDDVITLFSSNDTSGLKEDIIEWYNENIEVFNANNDTLVQIESMDNLINNSNKFVEAAKAGEVYHYESYNINNMISDLEKAYNLLSSYGVEKLKYKTVSDKEGTVSYIEDPVKAANNALLYKYLGTPKLTDKGNIDEGGYSYGGTAANATTVIAPVFLNFVEKTMDELERENKINFEHFSVIQDYIELFSTTINYLDKYALDYGLSSEQQNKVNEIRTLYSGLADMYDVYIVVDCKGLLGEELVNKINSVLDLVKIAIPIILVGYGIFDFAKAVFLADENKMKECQTKFLKRIGIAILIFFTPTMVRFILSIANMVWKFISPDTCGIFG